MRRRLRNPHWGASSDDAAVMIFLVVLGAFFGVASLWLI